MMYMDFFPGTKHAPFHRPLTPCQSDAAGRARRTGGQGTGSGTSGVPHDTAAGRDRWRWCYLSRGGSAAARRNRSAVMPLSDCDSTLCSQDSTPSNTRTQLTWQYSTETFVIAAADSRAGTVMPHTLMPVLEGRLYFMSSDRELHTSGSSTMHFFTMDQEMRYNPFCNDYG